MYVLGFISHCKLKIECVVPLIRESDVIISSARPAGMDSQSNVTSLFPSALRKL